MGARDAFQRVLAYLFAAFLVLLPKSGFAISSVSLTWGYGLLCISCISVCLGRTFLPFESHAAQLSGLGTRTSSGLRTTSSSTVSYRPRLGMGRAIRLTFARASWCVCSAVGLLSDLRFECPQKRKHKPEYGIGMRLVGQVKNCEGGDGRCRTSPC